MTMIAKILQELSLVEPGQAPAFIASWSMSTEDQYLFVPIHHTRKIRVFRLGESIEELPERWSTSDFVPACIEHVRGSDQREYLMIADGEGRIYYPTMAGFITGEAGKWGTYIDLHHILDPERSGRPQIDVWRLARYTLPNQTVKLFALGAYEDPGVGGFVQMFDLVDGSLAPQARVTRIEEAPYDIGFYDDMVFIAAGRAGHIEVRNIHELQKVAYTIRSRFKPFKPVKLAVARKRRQLWVASYDTLFWSDISDGTIRGRVQVATGVDCVGGFAFTQDEERIYATCIYSNRLCEVDLSNFQVRDLAVTGGYVQQPNWVKVLGRRIFVLGHSNGKLWAIEMASNT